MKTLNLSALAATVEAIEKTKKPTKAQLAEFADALQTLKFITSMGDELYTRSKEVLKERNITELESDNVEITASYRAGAMRYDSDKLNSYFAKQKIDSTKFKTQVADSFVIAFKPKA